MDREVVKLATYGQALEALQFVSHLLFTVDIAFVLDAYLGCLNNFVSPAVFQLPYPSPQGRQGLAQVIDSHLRTQDQVL